MNEERKKERGRGKDTMYHAFFIVVGLSDLNLGFMHRQVGILSDELSYQAMLIF